MRFFTIFVLLFLALAAYGQQISVAVLPSDGEALNGNELEALTDEMREAALKVLPTSAFVLLKQDVVVKRLGGAENFIKECKESSCIVDLGKKAQVDYVAQASVFKLGNSIRLKAELYDVRTEGLVSMFNDNAKNIEDLLSAVKNRAPTEVFSKILSTSDGSKATTVPVSIGGVIDGYLTDSRDGKKYKAVKIGTQTWMAENLNYNASGSKCYSNQESNCQKYGRLYDWNTAKTACPKGWHLPSNADWNVLMRTVNPSCSENSNCAGAGKKLKATIGWNKNSNGEDKFGFSALPGGHGFLDGNFHSVGDWCNWWSANEYNSVNVYGWDIFYSNEYAYWKNYDLKDFLFSVRCLQD